MKKLFLIFTLLLLFIFTFVQKVSAEQLYKFTSANFDTSNSVIVLSGQDTQGGAVLNNIKLVKLENPSRAYFDINNALSWEHKYSNPIEITEIIGVFIDNFDSFNISMWICLDKGVYINVTDKNADYLIKYLYERYPY